MVTPAFGLGRWAPFNYERDQHTTFIRLFWRRIALWSVLLICMAWLAAATGLFVFVKYQRGFDDVRFQHMLLLPWKLDNYRKDKGVFIINQGLELAAKQEWRKAFDLLRTGLPTAPEHLEARLMVARIYLMAGRSDMARTTLVEGLKYHGDQVDYLRDALGFFFGLEADTTVIGLTRELRARLDPTTVAARMATTALAYAYVNRDRFDEAEEVVRSARILGTPEGRFVLARIAWGKGSHDEALARLTDLSAKAPRNNEFYRMLVSYLREERRWSQLRLVSLSRQFAIPDNPEAYVDFMAACSEEGDEVGLGKAEAAYLVRFRDDSGALIKLAEQAGRGGRVEVARAVMGRCRELGRDEPDAALHLIGAMLEQRAYDQVLSEWSGLRTRVSEWPERHKLVLAGLRSVAHFGLNEEMEAQLLVEQLFDTRQLPASVLTALAIHLDRVGQKTEALRVLRFAVEIDPLNQPALAMLLSAMLAEQQFDGAPVLLDRLLGMRRPQMEVLQGFAEGLGSDRFLFHPAAQGMRVKLKDYIAKRLALSVAG